MKATTTLLAASILALAPFAVAADWAQWRGPAGTGLADGNPPVEWSETKNVKWKTAIPGRGHASPIVLGNHVYVVTSVDMPPAPGAADAGGNGNANRTPGGPNTEDLVEADQDRERRQDRRSRRGRGNDTPIVPQKFMMLCIDRDSGAIVWTTTVKEMTPNEGHHRTSTYAAGSPVTNGKHVYVNLGTAGVHCLTLDGKSVWSKDLGVLRTRNAFGPGASAALHGNTLVVPWDHEGDSFIVALDATNGDEKWRRTRDEPTSWATPVVTELTGRPQVIMPGYNSCVGYDLETGADVWRSEGLTLNVVPTPVIGHGMVYLTSGFRGSELHAVRLDRAKGDIAGTDAIAWKHGRGTPYVPSPMLSGTRLYFLGSNNGILSCVDALTGEPHYVGERLGAVRNVYSSIVGAAGHVYVCGREGNVAVIKDGPEFEHLYTNTLDEGINASPAIVGDAMYLRGARHLYCIARD
jgi:outer membrane protein assembly factor BamB